MGKKKVKKARMVEVIEVTSVEGDGTPSDLYRMEESYWTKEGAFIGTVKARTTVKMESIYGGDERVALLVGQLGIDESDEERKEKEMVNEDR